LEAVFILLEFPSPSRRIFIGSHSLHPSLVRRIGPSQSLLGKIKFVRRFISNFSLKVLRFSPLLRIKKDQKFVWGDKQQKAFDEIKQYMKEPPVLVPPQLNKPFKLYVAADTQTIGSALIQEFEGKERIVAYLS
jgi:hypothetical protein